MISQQVVELATRAGISRVLDANLRVLFYVADMIRESVRLARILKLSDDELLEVCPACGISTNADPDMTL